MPDELTDADQAHRAAMRSRLDRAAGHFSVTVVGEPVFSGQERSIGARARGADGICWLRVSWSHDYWAAGDYWTGNQTASVLTGIPKPAILADPYDWAEPPYVCRAEMMTLVADPPCSTTEELRTELDVPDQWWSELRSTVDTLAQQSTQRRFLTQHDVTCRLLAFFGGQIDPIVTKWVTGHNDLNWTNLTHPRLTVLDWESWGTTMYGYDAATLYILSLVTPETATRVHDTFADILDSPDGLRAQLLAITRYLKRVENGEFMDYADHLHEHARRLMGNLPEFVVTAG